MSELLNMLRQFNIVSVLLRLILAMLFGGMIGMERGRKRRPAGFRTYMLVCMGSALTIMLGQYEFQMIVDRWAVEAAACAVPFKADVSRFGAKVLNGIGFLGAGTIIVTGRQEVKGLTTAAGLWASACMGLAIGAGFYECVLLSFVLIFLTIRLLPHLETVLMERARNMNLYVEFKSLDNIGEILDRIKEQAVQIYDVELDRGREEGKNPSVIFTLRLHKQLSHTQMLAAISDLDCICTIDEI